MRGRALRAVSDRPSAPGPARGPAAVWQAPGGRRPLTGSTASATTNRPATGPASRAGGTAPGSRRQEGPAGRYRGQDRGPGGPQPRYRARTGSGTRSGPAVPNRGCRTPGGTGPGPRQDRSRTAVPDRSRTARTRRDRSRTAPVPLGGPPAAHRSATPTGGNPLGWPAGRRPGNRLPSATATAAPEHENRRRHPSTRNDAARLAPAASGPKPVRRICGDLQVVVGAAARGGGVGEVAPNVLSVALPALPVSAPAQLSSTVRDGSAGAGSAQPGPAGTGNASVTTPPDRGTGPVLPPGPVPYRGPGTGTATGRGTADRGPDRSSRPGPRTGTGTAQDRPRTAPVPVGWGAVPRSRTGLRYRYRPRCGHRDRARYRRCQDRTAVLDHECPGPAADDRRSP